MISDFKAPNSSRMSEVSRIPSSASGPVASRVGKSLPVIDIETRRADYQLLWVICLLTFIFRIVTLVRWGTNYLWPDEVYQSLEQAHRAVFGYGIVPWEYRDGVRSWVFPGALAGLMAVGIPFGKSGYIFVPRLVLSLLSVTPVAVTFLWARRGFGRNVAAVLAFAVGAWFELVYFAPKALTEVVGTHLMIPGLYLLIEYRGIDYKRRAYVAGALLAMAALLRMQLAPGIAVTFLSQVLLDWQARREHFRRLKILCLGAVPVIALFGIVDAITWHYPFRSVWNYFYVNIISGKASKYGVLPFDAFWEYFANVWSMLLVPLVLLAVRGARGKWPLLIGAIATFFVHSAIAHKEYRFDYPVVVTIVMLAAIGTADGVSRLAKVAFLARRRYVLPWAALVLWVGASLGLALRFDMSLIQVPMELNHTGRPWTVRKGAMAGMREIGRDPNTCGVGLIYVGWGYVGGYSYLHRNLPMFEIRHRGELAKMSHLVNALIVRGRVRDFSPYKLERCWEEYCVYRRPGGCQPPEPGYNINNLLVSRKQ